jgi:molybdopterin-guanine dinucleotide biosynthesis protein A
MNGQMDGFVLAGGASSRMGADKAALEFDGKTLVELTAAILAAVCPRVVVVGYEEPVLVEGTPIESFPDLTSGPERAPIKGLLTALVHSKTPWMVLLACDLPLVTPDLIERLATYRTDDADAVVPIQNDERPQPLCALYRRETVLPVVRERLSRRQLKMQDLLVQIRTRWVDPDDYSDLDHASDVFLNINTPEDLEAARSVLAG